MGRIVFAGNSAWGMYNFRGKLMKKFNNLGHEVIVIVPYDEYVNELISLGIQVKVVNLKAKSFNPFSDLFLFVQYFTILIKLNEQHASNVHLVTASNVHSVTL